MFIIYKLDSSFIPIFIGLIFSSIPEILYILFIYSFFPQFLFINDKSSTLSSGSNMIPFSSGLLMGLLTEF